MKPVVAASRPLKWLIWSLIAAAATLGLVAVFRANLASQRALQAEVQRLQRENEAKQAELVRRMIPSDVGPTELHPSPAPEAVPQR